MATISAQAIADEPPLRDVIGPDLVAVFWGLNPGLRAAASGYHFEGRDNRSRKATHLAGFTDRELRPAECGELRAFGFGLATVVCRPTASAIELAADEYAEASGHLIRWLERYQPKYVAFLGKAAYASMRSQKVVSCGPPRRGLAPQRPGFCPTRADETAASTSLISSTCTPSFASPSADDQANGSPWLPGDVAIPHDVVHWGRRYSRLHYRVPD
ncbi:mismatch-specific DNA-glycosylase [Cupriavidus sp. 2TAF22]|uniref:mismatch-specific DNA-glycosylase n=1 Tax=unclassified Cupriavidus TaxID=2640874 RepID=UPI003F915212